MKLNPSRSARSIRTVSVLAVGLGIGLNSNMIMEAVSGTAKHKGIQVGMLGELPEKTLKSAIGLKGYTMRMRWITIKPGGQIERHNHANSPGIVTVVEGELVEGNRNGEATHTQPEILTFAQRYQNIKRGDTYRSFTETKDIIHWIYNRSDRPATALVCDLAKS